MHLFIFVVLVITHWSLVIALIYASKYKLRFKMLKDVLVVETGGKEEKREYSKDLTGENLLLLMSPA